MTFHATLEALQDVIYYVSRVLGIPGNTWEFPATFSRR